MGEGRLLQDQAAFWVSSFLVLMVTCITYCRRERNWWPGEETGPRGQVLGLGHGREEGWCGMSCAKSGRVLVGRPA